MKKKQIWVSPQFHKQLKKQALNEDMNVIEFTNKIKLFDKGFKIIGGENEKKKKKFTFSI